MSEMVDGFLKWSEALGVSGEMVAPPLKEGLDIQGFLTITIFLPDSCLRDVPMIKGDKTIAAALVERGLIPSAPYSPSLAFSIRVLELYRTTNLRCPHLAIQPFVKSLCDLHGKPFKPYLSKQFSIAYDVYLAILEETDHRVQAALKRDTPQWRLRHACPACTYKLEDEDPLAFNMLFTMDGNDSLKRVICRQLAVENDEGEMQAGASKELRDDRE
ncbi:hypothetical protein C0991_011533, partial [Blastosporella zonata]